MLKCVLVMGKRVTTLKTAEEISSNTKTSIYFIMTIVSTLSLHVNRQNCILFAAGGHFIFSTLSAPIFKCNRFYTFAREH